MCIYHYELASFGELRVRLSCNANGGRLKSHFEGLKMELPNIGKQCTVESCKQLDFLPFTCNQCKLIFCLEHKDRDSHNCPITEDTTDYAEPLKTKSYHCSLETCTAKELVAVICPKCEKNFCMRHRHQGDHFCEKLELKVESTQTPKERVESVIGRELKVKAKEPKGGKMSKTAAKVALMKMKMHAIGDKGIPQTEREYFNIQMPEGENQWDIVPMYFSKKWSIGKIIDNAAELKGLANKNNISGEKKLRLLDINDTELDPSGTLESLINHGIIDLNERQLKMSYS